jgi:hypothetical protein
MFPKITEMIEICNIRHTFHLNSIKISSNLRHDTSDLKGISDFSKIITALSIDSSLFEKITDLDVIGNPAKDTTSNSDFIFITVNFLDQRIISNFFGVENHFDFEDLSFEDFVRIEFDSF